jgi:hypothetical protein
LRVVVADNFEATIAIAPVKNPDDREVKSPELPPCFGAMAIFDLGNNAEMLLMINEQPIRLTPSAPGSILELNPGAGDVFRARLAANAVSEVSLGFPFICYPTSFGSAGAPPCDKRWLCIEQFRPTNLLRRDKASRWWG